MTFSSTGYHLSLNGGRHGPEQLDGFERIGWTASPEYAGGASVQGLVEGGMSRASTISRSLGGAGSGLTC
jgi:hypothetical protein